MECKYESAIKPSSSSVEAIYAKISDFSHLGDILPREHVSDWQSTADSCSFTIANIGKIGLQIVDRELNAMVKYSADEQTQVKFFLWVQLKQNAENQARVKVTFKADLNPMIKMMIGKKLDQFVDSLATSIANFRY